MCGKAMPFRETIFLLCCGCASKSESQPQMKRRSVGKPKAFRSSGGGVAIDLFIPMCLRRPGGDEQQRPEHRDDNQSDEARVPSVTLHQRAQAPARKHCAGI